MGAGDCRNVGAWVDRLRRGLGVDLASEALVGLRNLGGVTVAVLSGALLWALEKHVSAASKPVLA